MESTISNKNENILKDVRKVNTLLDGTLKGFIGDIPKEQIYLNSLNIETRTDLIKKSLGELFNIKSKYILIHHNIKGDGFYSLVNKKENNRILKCYTSFSSLFLYIKRKDLKISRIVFSNSHSYTEVLN